MADRPSIDLAALTADGILSAVLQPYINRMAAVEQELERWEESGVKPEDSDLGRMQNKVEQMRDAFDELWGLAQATPDKTPGKRRMLELIDLHRRTDA